MMCCCIDRLRTKGEVRIVGRQRSVELAMRVTTPAEAQKIKTAIKQQLSRMPGCRNNPLLQAEYHHIKLKCPFEFCKKYEEFTEQDTKIDNVSLSVMETHKTKPQRATIPPSLCCPICWCSLIKRLCRCCLPKIRATDVHEQDIFHHSGTEMTNVYSMPNCDMSSLLRTWLIFGIFGGHLFKAGRFREGVCRIVLWGQLLFALVGLLACTIAWAVVSGYEMPAKLSRDDCTAQNYKNFPECGNYFVATAGRCEDTEGAATIRTETDCLDAVHSLGYDDNHNFNSVCTGGCGLQFDDHVPDGCFYNEGYGPALNLDQLGNSNNLAMCGSHSDYDYSNKCLCKGGSCPKNTYCPSESKLCGLHDCVGCPDGTLSPPGATDISECIPYFVATSGLCEDVEGATTIQTEEDCLDALHKLGHDKFHGLCTYGCGRDSDLMPDGCLHNAAYGGIMKHPVDSGSGSGGSGGSGVGSGGPARCGKREGVDESADCICKTSSSYRPSGRRSLKNKFVKRLKFHTMPFHRYENISTPGNANSAVSDFWGTAAKYLDKLRGAWKHLQKARERQTFHMMPNWFFLKTEPDLRKFGLTTRRNNDTICHAWMRSKAESFAHNTKKISSSSPVSPHLQNHFRRRYLVVDFDPEISKKIVKQTTSMINQASDSLILLLLSLWLVDLFRLRSFLNSTHVEFSSVQSFQLMWTKPWACYLNNRKEADELLDIMHKTEQEPQIG